jgi:hypothetical protein
MSLPSIVCEKCGATLAVLDEKQGKPILRLTTGLAFHTESPATCPGCGHETRVDLDILEKLIPNVSTAD